MKFSNAYSQSSLCCILANLKITPVTKFETSGKLRKRKYVGNSLQGYSVHIPQGRTFKFYTTNRKRKRHPLMYDNIQVYMDMVCLF